MTITINKPIVKRFRLAYDSEGEAWVEIRQATVGARKERGDETATIRQRVDAIGSMLEQDINPYELQLFDIYLCLSGWGGFKTVAVEQDPEGNDTDVESDFEPFKFAVINGVKQLSHTKGQFNAIINQYVIPQELIDEIHGKVLEINPDFLNRGGRN